jgi:UDP-3-O-[3-hydroxymyristoyl] glucosamine N-acyltransferase
VFRNHQDKLAPIDICIQSGMIGGLAMKPPKASDIALHLGRELIGDDIAVEGACSLTNARPSSVCFAVRLDSATIERLNALKSVVVLAGPEYRRALSVSHVVTERPRLDFARVLDRFFSGDRRDSGIASTAQISPHAQLGAGVAVGHFTVIGDDVIIGDGTVIRDHVSVKAATIGCHSVIQPHVVIGAEGFGFEFDEGDRPIRIPHIGRVVIGDCVEIGSQSHIARGTLDDTILESHVKTNTGVHIAHNVTVGEATLVHAGVSISGSTRIGHHVWLAPGVVVMNKVEVGDYALVGLGSLVTRSIPDNVVAFGSPATVRRKRYEEAGGGQRLGRESE